jgi:hypothetical protein
MNIHNYFFNAFGELQWMPIAIVIFAVIFLVISVYRTVEFKGVGLNPGKRRALMAFHVIGSSLFAAALMMGAINLVEDRRTLMYSLFVSAMVFIAPGQFTIGMIRRRVLEEEHRRSSGKM